MLEEIFNVMLSFASVRHNGYYDCVSVYGAVGNVGDERGMSAVSIFRLWAPDEQGRANDIAHTVCCSERKYC